MMIGTVRIADPMNRRSISRTMCAPCPWWSVMGASVQARHPFHLHTALAGACRPQLEKDRRAHRRAAPIRTNKTRGHKVERPAPAQAGGEPCDRPDGALVTKGQRADIVLRRRGNRGNNQLRGALPHVLGATEEGVRSVKVDRTLSHDAAREWPGPDLVVRAVDQRARPRSAGADRLRSPRCRADSVEGLVGVEPFGTLQV